jgi:hypothetical protein
MTAHQKYNLAFLLLALALTLAALSVAYPAAFAAP